MKPKHILLVEDELLIGKDLKNSLIMAGFDSVNLVNNSDGALKYMQNTNRPDVVIMDISLDYGKMNGIHTAQQIKDKYDIPIVFMSGYFDDITLKNAKEVSSYGFIAKPVNYAELAMVLEDAYDRHLSNMGINQIEKETEICQENLI